MLVGEIGKVFLWIETFFLGFLKFQFFFRRVSYEHQRVRNRGSRNIRVCYWLELKIEIETWIKLLHSDKTDFFSAEPLIVVKYSRRTTFNNLLARIKTPAHKGPSKLKVWVVNVLESVSPTCFTATWFFKQLWGKIEPFLVYRMMRSFNGNWQTVLNWDGKIVDKVKKDIFFAKCCVSTYFAKFGDIVS